MRSFKGGSLFKDWLDERTNFPRGRMIVFCARCSNTCAMHPADRDNRKQSARCLMRQAQGSAKHDKRFAQIDPRLHGWEMGLDHLQRL